MPSRAAQDLSCQASPSFANAFWLNMWLQLPAGFLLGTVFQLVVLAACNKRLFGSAR